MSRENDHIDRRIACLQAERIPAALISTMGYHCEVWRSNLRLYRDGVPRTYDLVIKVPRETYSVQEASLLRRDYRRLRERLGSIIPRTQFVVTEIDGQSSVFAISEAVSRWFDIANPAHEEEAVPLFRKLRLARADLMRFVEAADAWDTHENRVIDLYGLENMVLDRAHRLRYLDSFRVFFYADMLHAIDGEDETLRQRIELSRLRRDYLRFLVEASR
ncbi:hypothetical protein H0Z60_18500 [Ectothiorhodospiraceae bacterium WFHF3C12]|nr:hypothetical protein [Ectothiorhodospiraceae bacterium WFHF3C12]